MTWPYVAKMGNEEFCFHKPKEGDSVLNPLAAVQYQSPLSFLKDLFLLCCHGYSLSLCWKGFRNRSTYLYGDTFAVKSFGGDFAGSENTCENRDFKSATCAVCFSSKSALYSGLLACEVFKRYVSFQFLCLSYNKRFSTQVCTFYGRLTTTYKSLRFQVK